MRIDDLREKVIELRPYEAQFAYRLEVVLLLRDARAERDLEPARLLFECAHVDHQIHVFAGPGMKTYRVRGVCFLYDLGSLIACGNDSCLMRCRADAVVVLPKGRDETADEWLLAG